MKHLDKDKVIERLISEQEQSAKIFKDLERVLRSDPEFEGLTLVGGLKAVLRRFREEKEKVFKLKQEINNLLSK